MNPTFEYGAYIPNGNVALAHKLTQSHFQEQHWNTPSDHIHEIRYQKRSSSILVAKIRKSPNIAQPNGESHAGQYKFHSIAPNVSFGHISKTFLGRRGLFTRWNHYIRSGTSAIFPMVGLLLQNHDMGRFDSST